MSNKPRKKDKDRFWIQGVYRSKWDADRPKFPPVTPWVTPDQLELLIDFLLPYEARSDIDQLLSNNAHELARLRTQVSLTAVQMRWLRSLETTRTELWKEFHAARNHGRERLRKNLLNLSMLRGVREVQVLNGKLVFVTCPIIIKNYVLGSYNLGLTPGETTPSEALSLQRRDHISSEWGYHPHWTHRPCFGNYGPILQQLLTKRDYVAAVGCALNFLASYNPSSPLRRITSFNRVSGDGYNADPTR